MPFTVLLNKPENVSVDGIVTRHADDLTTDNLEHAHPFFPGKMEKKDFIKSLSRRASRTCQTRSLI